MNLQMNERAYSILGAVISWLALIVQLYLLLLSRTMSVPATLLHFFSFFTIQSNLMAAFGFSLLALGKAPHGDGVFSKTSIATAIVVYIGVVGIVYNLVLRYLWHPQGLHKIVDELLHVLNPLIVLLFWIKFIPKDQLKWDYAFKWLFYPFLYVVFILIRGSVTQLYPYPFVDLTILPLSKVLVNALILSSLFYFLGLLLIALGKYGRPFRR